jgi:hypothetical protein
MRMASLIGVVLSHDIADIVVGSELIRFWKSRIAYTAF